MAHGIIPAMVTFGKAVRAFRMAKGCTQEYLAQTINYSKAWLSNLETGQLRPDRKVVIAIEKALGIKDEALLDLYDELSQESIPRWLKDWLDEERRATVLRAFQHSVIYGLLQTEDYARALLGDEAALQARMARQKRLSGNDAPNVICVLDELVLYREVGGREVMKAQLEHLLTCTSPNVAIQIVPAAGNPHRMGAFEIATVDGKDVAYVETAVRALITNGREDLQRLNDVWESIRSQSLPVGMSMDLIRRTIEERWS